MHHLQSQPIPVPSKSGDSLAGNAGRLEGDSMLCLHTFRSQGARLLQAGRSKHCHCCDGGRLAHGLVDEGHQVGAAGVSKRVAEGLLLGLGFVALEVLMEGILWPFDLAELALLF